MNCLNQVVLPAIWKHANGWGGHEGVKHSPNVENLVIFRAIFLAAGVLVGKF